MPIDAFVDDIWLDIVQCEKRGWLNVEFNDKNFVGTYIEDLIVMYSAIQGSDDVKKDWEKFHTEILS